MDQPGGPASDPGTAVQMGICTGPVASWPALWLTAGRENRSPETGM
jgi:hypothetical protein